VPLAGIARVTGVSECWLQNYVNKKYDVIEQKVKVKIKKSPLRIQCDEMWSFVGNKGNKQWIWLAMDVGTREIVGLYVGSRDREGALGLWNSYPVFIVNVLFVIQIFGHLTGKSFLLKDTVLLVRKVEKQVILKGLIAQ